MPASSNLLQHGFVDHVIGLGITSPVLGSATEKAIALSSRSSRSMGTRVSLAAHLLKGALGEHAPFFDKDISGCRVDFTSLLARVSLQQARGNPSR
jgi:hypothetical protein